MSFTGDEGGSITLSTASQYTANYRSANPSGIHAHFFGKNVINSILNQSGCKGIRIYYGIDGNGTQQLVMVGADANEMDQTSGYIMDRSVPCPSCCDTTSQLNGYSGNG